ncbi:RAB6-interacting golgin [Pseudolycoriella hygida]|uniref:RAB6-interacting golgin n=1 Tax=Pseudolycoriella hygida TaxID=35572 RepID=A0A9Q0S265_9DIPT|nr:RAB6-interacting golgin [Pseudolycoriella hygida]
MSGKFHGFSQDYIEKLKSNPKTNRENNKPNISERTKSHPPAKATTMKQQSVEKPAFRPVDSKQEINEELSNNHLKDALHFKPLPAKPLPSEEIAELEKEIKKSDNLTGNPLPFKGISLKDYESQRRMVEEQNKQKKEILYRAIEQHSERTAAEAKKLQEIKRELHKLESELAADVSVLRRQIEDASVKYMNAEKSYEQIETAFLSAKANLFKAREKKELLVEHLNIIISNNEDRKAKKLSELMEKVGLTPLGETATVHSNGAVEDETISGN